MLLAGDNTRFGAERVYLSEERFVDVFVHDDEPFPLGVEGLVPVVTQRRKKGGYKTVYALPLEQGELAVADKREAEGAEDGFLRPQDRLAFEIREAVDFVNLLLGEAAELSGYPFGTIGAIHIGVTDAGYGFTRVEKALPNEYGERGSAPIHLRIETSDRATETGTVSAVIEYDQLGYPLNVQIVEYGEGSAVRRVTCAIDFDARDLLVQKVVEDGAGRKEPLVLYWRHPPYWYESDGYRADREVGRQY